MPRYFIQLSFNGKNYHGWQVQQNAHSVQAALNMALKTLLKVPVETTGCGRTDTGVHAKMFFAHFDSAIALENKKKITHQLNSILPADIAVQNIFTVPDDAHARFDATSRTYQYNIYNFKDPFLADTACFIPYELDLNAMNELCAILLAPQEAVDYTCFSKSGTQTKTNNCRITVAGWKEKQGIMIFTITADRFLRNMVRAIVGTMLMAGQGKLNKQGFKKIIESKGRSNAGASVPAHGLYLTDVQYPYKLK